MRVPYHTPCPGGVISQDDVIDTKGVATMLTAGTVLFIALTYLVMLVAYRLPHRPMIHRPVMAGIMILDLFFPFYLYANKDWVRRLIEQQEILSFMVWMHLMLVITLYILYVVQVMSARKLLGGDKEARLEHKSQGLGIIIVRGLVLLSAAMLVEPISEA